MTVCDAVGALYAGGRVVAEIRCDREAGHADGTFPRIVSAPGAIPTVYQFEATPHSMTLTWAPEAEPDLELFDPDERFDAVVPFDVEGPCLVPGCVLVGPHGVHAD